MLVLTRKIGQRIQLGSNISLTVVRIRGGQVRVAIEAPKDVGIYRSELAGGEQRPARAATPARSKPAAR